MEKTSWGKAPYAILFILLALGLYFLGHYTGSAILSLFSTGSRDSGGICKQDLESIDFSLHHESGCVTIESMDLKVNGSLVAGTEKVNGWRISLSDGTYFNNVTIEEHDADSIHLHSSSGRIKAVPIQKTIRYIEVDLNTEVINTIGGHAIIHRPSDVSTAGTDEGQLVWVGTHGNSIVIGVAQQEEVCTTTQHMK